MALIKKFRFLLVLMLVIAAILGTAQYMHIWPLRFHKDLDAYFGEENWKWISPDEIENYRYDIYQRVPNHTTNCLSDSGKHHSWYIAFQDSEGQHWMWRMTDHTYYVSMHHRGAMGGFTARDGLTAELMELSFRRGCYLLSQRVLNDVLSQEELNCLRFEVSYRGGNPGHALYEKLRQQPWFDSGHVMEYLNWDYHDFYLNIYPYNHRAERLPEDTREHLLGSLSQVENALQNSLGEYCDYKVHLGQDHQGNPVRGEFSVK